MKEGCAKLGLLPSDLWNLKAPVTLRTLVPAAAKRPAWQMLTRNGLDAGWWMKMPLLTATIW